MTRSLARRLERLEEQVIPADELKIWQIVIVDSDGAKTLGDRIEWSPQSRQWKNGRRRNRWTVVRSGTPPLRPMTKDLYQSLEHLR